MGEVIRFPTNDARKIAEIAGVIREHLRKHGVSDEMADTVLRNMAEFMKMLNFEFTLSLEDHGADIHEQIDALVQALRQRTHQLLLERVMVEIDRCRLLGMT